MILLRPVCWLLGHRRGTYVRTFLNQRYFQCGRCGRQTRYKSKPELRTAPSDGSPHREAA